MNNYPYIIACLPDLLLDYGQQQLDYDALRDEIKGQCSDKDARLIDLLDTSREASHHFYQLASRKSNTFIRNWFAFDRQVRLAKVAYLEGKRFNGEFDGLERLEEIFHEANLIQREMKLDAFIWDKAAELVTFDLFDIDVILSALVRARIIERWQKLDQKAGEEFFKRLVSEVRGTFAGVKYDSNSK